MAQYLHYASVLTNTQFDLLLKSADKLQEALLLMSFLQSKDSALFVYLAWGTRHNHPLLADEEVRQAAYLATTIRTRSQFCHVLAIGGTENRVHLIAQFPPSLSISNVIRMAQDAGGNAIAQWSEIYQGRLIHRDRLWDCDYTTRTLPQINAAEARAYLRLQISQEDPSQPADQK